MTDEIYMKRCLELAELGLGNVSPNPMVGCVIVHKNIIIGEGYHQKIGEAHAEVHAINNVIEQYGDKASDLLKDATAYVNLEPCAHFGKTPPCADLLIKHKIKKVVVGNKDVFAKVDGKGIEKLKNAGIEVVANILEEDCSFLNRRFFTRVINQRPFIILKWAETANGYFAPIDGTKKWITGPIAKQLAHKWRGEEDAILVGKQTSLIDNPELTNRNAHGKSPIRLVIDRDLTIPETHNIYNKHAKTIIFNEVKTEVVKNVHFVQMEDMKFYLPQKIAFQLYLMDIQSVIIEGGIQILNQFIEANLWDEARILTSSDTWNEGLSAPKITGLVIEQMNVGNDKLKIYTPQDKV